MQSMQNSESDSEHPDDISLNNYNTNVEKVSIWKLLQSIVAWLLPWFWRLVAGVILSLKQNPVNKIAVFLASNCGSQESLCWLLISCTCYWNCVGKTCLVELMTSVSFIWQLQNYRWTQTFIVVDKLWLCLMVATSRWRHAYAVYFHLFVLVMINTPTWFVLPQCAHRSPYLYTSLNSYSCHIHDLEDEEVTHRG